MILEKTFYAVKCDNCGIVCEDDIDAPKYWDDKGFAEDIAKESDWEELGGNHYCPDCYSYNDDDEFQIHLNRQKPL